MDESREFNELHLPHLLHYVVPILWNPTNLGSGVLVNVQGRHFVATAAHCIQSRPWVLFRKAPINLIQPVEMRTLRILCAVWHDTLDIGYLEIENPECAELGWNQLSEDLDLGGRVHVVGYPTAHAQIDPKRMEALLGENAFETNLIESTPEYLKLDYPKEGARYDAASGKCVRHAFPDTPKGFSGGACFGVTKTTEGGVEVVHYMLLGIQYEWHPVERWVKVVPIKHWLNLLKENGAIT